MVTTKKESGVDARLALAPYAFTFTNVIMLLSIMLSEFAILERNYATHMLA